MRQPRAAAFDPIFWLHHAYVDRLLALWSAMNPDAWVTPGPAIDGTFTIPWAESLTVDTSVFRILTHSILGLKGPRHRTDPILERPKEVLDISRREDHRRVQLQVY
jgi:hypothetical protein